MTHIILSKEWGVYLGTFIGFGIWSKLDPAGQDAACIFETIESAREYINSWDGQEYLPKDFSFPQVEGDTPPYWASMKECIKAGAELWNP